MVYTLKVNGRFAASHVLPGHRGACARLHGHTWTVTAVVGGGILDGNGMLMDFQDLKGALARVLEPLDHRHLNDLPAFAGERPPTAENLARHIFRELSALLPPGVALTVVEVGESPDSFASFREGDEF